MQFANYKGLWQRLANNKSSTVKRIFLTATSFFSCFSFSFRFASTVQRYCFKLLPQRAPKIVVFSQFCLMKFSTSTIELKQGKNMHDLYHTAYEFRYMWCIGENLCVISRVAPFFILRLLSIILLQRETQLCYIN